jgi:RNA polymerase sigma factor (sigma-70 family)
MTVSFHLQTALNQYPLLTEGEEKALFAEYAQTRAHKLRNKIVNHNLRLVIGQCEKLGGRARRDPDLHQEATLGLIRAVEDFDPSRGYKFSTYAVTWINNYIYKFIPSYGRSVSLEKSRVKFWAAQKTWDVETPKDQDLKSLSVVPEKAKQIRASLLAHDCSLDERGPDGESPVMELVSEGINSEEAVVAMQANSKYQKELAVFRASLSERDRIVFQERVINEKLLAEVGEMIKVSKEYVRQREVDIKDKFKRFAMRNCLQQLMA